MTTICRGWQLRGKYMKTSKLLSPIWQKTVTWYRNTDRRAKLILWMVIAIIVVCTGSHLYHSAVKRQLVAQHPWYFLIGTPQNELPSAMAKHNSGASKLTFYKNGTFKQVAADYASDPEKGTWQVDGHALLLKDSEAQTTQAQLVSVSGTAGQYRYVGYKLTHIQMTAVDGSDLSGATVYLVRSRWGRLDGFECWFQQVKFVKTSL